MLNLNKEIISNWKTYIHTHKPELSKISMTEKTQRQANYSILKEIKEKDKGRLKRG